MDAKHKKIQEINIFMQPEDALIDRVRVGCRGILVKDGKILLSYEAKKNRYFLPGGGLEEGETPEEACVREMIEETGIRVRVIEHLVTVNCIYKGVNYRNYFFVCEYVGTEERNLTDEEVEAELIPYYMDFEKALRFFGDYQVVEGNDLPLSGCYHRDFEVLKLFLKKDYI